MTSSRQQIAILYDPQLSIMKGDHERTLFGCLSKLSSSALQISRPGSRSALPHRLCHRRLLQRLRSMNVGGALTMRPIPGLSSFSDRTSSMPPGHAYFRLVTAWSCHCFSPLRVSVFLLKLVSVEYQNRSRRVEVAQVNQHRQCIENATAKQKPFREQFHTVWSYRAQSSPLPRKHDPTRNAGARGSRLAIFTLRPGRRPIQSRTAGALPIRRLPLKRPSSTALV